MADAYTNRLVKNLTDLARALESSGYRNEGSRIRTLIGRVNGWKEGHEWNKLNSRSIGDADHVLENLSLILFETINEMARKKLEEKSKESEEPEEETPESTKELESAEKAAEKAIQSLQNSLGKL